MKQRWKYMYTNVAEVKLPTKFLPFTAYYSLANFLASRRYTHAILYHSLPQAVQAISHHVALPLHKLTYSKLARKKQDSTLTIYIKR